MDLLGTIYKLDTFEIISIFIKQIKKTANEKFTHIIDRGRFS